MAHKSANYRYLVLGLLAQQPMSGYDIKNLLSNLSWLVSSPSFGSLYPTLHALQRDGLVTMTVVLRENKPPRKVYRITTAGNEALRAWIDQPVAAETSIRTFLMYLITAGACTPTALLTHLQQRRSQVAMRHSALERAASAQDATTGTGQHLIIDYALALAAAELAWLDQALQRLSMTTLPAYEQV